jgi:hypothetical protein
MKQETIFSPCRKWRYTLWRSWPIDIFSGSRGALMIIGLNPSTADETKDDPTIRRCIGFAKAWGFSSLCMTNLFAWRDTDPKGMKAAEDPVGPENDRWLLECSINAGLIIAAWGTHGAHLDRGNKVKAMIPNLHCMRQNSDGSPAHPLYLPGSLQPLLYT